MSETQNTPEPEFNMSDVRGKEIDTNAHDALDAAKEHQERLELAGSDENGASELLEVLTNLPQAHEVILPVIMPKGDKLVALGDAVFNPEFNKMVVSFNTVAGRDIAEFIGSGLLAAISFTGHMHKR